MKPRFAMALALLCGATAFCSPAFGAGTELVTTFQSATTPSATGQGSSRFASISKAGDRVAFTSTAWDLARGDTNGAGTDAYLAELATNPSTLRLLSGAVTRHGNTHSTVLSRNGRFVVFVSTEPGLEPTARAAVAHIYRRDLESNALTLVTRDASGGTDANGDSGEPQISEDGRYVCFTSAASNLIANDDNNHTDLFVRDLELGVTTRVLADAGDLSGRNTGLRGFELSADGQTLVFSYLGEPLTVPHPPTAATSVYVWRNGLGLTARLGLPGTPGAGYTPVEGFNLALSADGAIVVFTTPAIPESRLPQFPGGVLRVETESGITTVLSAADEARSISHIDDDYGAAINDDGSVVLFRGAGAKGVALSLWTKASGLKVLKSEIFPGGGIPARDIRLSANGKRAAFLAELGASSATDGTPLQLFGMDLESGEVRLLSRNTTGGPAGGVEGADPTLSGDGTRIVFASRSPELIANDRNGTSDVFLYDWNADQISVLSRAQPDLAALNATQLTGTAVRGVSADARHVLMESYASTVNGGTSGGVKQFLVKDLETGQTRLASASTNGVSGTKYGVEAGLISANGRYVAFTSTALDLVPDETIGMRHAYIRDLLTGEITLATRRTDPFLPRYQALRIDLLGLSAEGRFLLFRTTDPAAFVPGAPFGTQNHILYDRASGSSQSFLTPLSTAPSPALATHAPVMAVVELGRQMVGLTILRLELDTGHFEESSVPNLSFNSMLLSADGRRILVYTQNRVQTAMHYRDPGMKEFAPVALPEALRGPLKILSLSHDGTYALVETAEAVFRLNVKTGIAEPCVFDAAGQAMTAAPASRAAMDLWGETIVFQKRTMADGVTGDLNLYVTHMSQHRTEILVQGRDASPIDAPTTRPYINADGSRILFTSWAGNLASNDANGSSDVYTTALDVGAAADSDADGLEDAWELTWFATLARDGTGDADGDGISNAGEKLSGTVPIDGGSVLVVTLGAGSQGQFRASWPTVKGRTYGIRYRTQLESAWVELPDVIPGNGSPVEWTEKSPDAGQRFYQVVVRQP